jgi:folate-dependent phosphoribosylglycinamide formyltransferase PurN
VKSVLICHAGDDLTRYGFACWLGSFSDLRGIVEIHEDGARAKQRIRAELRRIGWLRFLFDVLPYRLYSRFVDAATDRAWTRTKLDELRAEYPELPEDVEILATASPNSAETREFLRRLAPDMVLARCKTLIKKEIYSIPPDGILILHPGVCPEYRNAHGCFWALANDEPDKVGMTLLRIDAGIDTGPVYGYYSYAFDVSRETPAIIHARVVYDNLDALREKILEVHAGTATPIDTRGRKSGVWGQPWLSKYLKIKHRASSG